MKTKDMSIKTLVVVFKKGTKIMHIIKIKNIIPITISLLDLLLKKSTSKLNTSTLLC